MYKLKKKEKDFKKSLIEKTYEEKSLFTVEQIETHQKQLKTKDVELTAQMNVNAAAMNNIERNHPFVKKLKPQDVNTVAMYHGYAMELSKAQKYRKEIRDVLKKYKAEIDGIYKELGFKDDEQRPETTRKTK